MRYLEIIQAGQAVDGQFTMDTHKMLEKMANAIRPHCGHRGKEALILTDTEKASAKTAEVMARQLSAGIEEVEGLWTNDPDTLRRVFRIVKSRGRKLNAIILIAPPGSGQAFRDYYKEHSPCTRVNAVEVIYSCK